ncbi:MAG: response regulator [Archangium sp.]|nr:response regulator [Archangium sp.]
MHSWIERLTLAALPQGLSSAELIRARFFVGAHFLAMPLMVLSTLAYAASGLWGQVVTTSAMFVISLVALVWHRRSRKLQGPTRLSLHGITAMFAGAALAQTPVDITNVCFLAVVPLLAAFTLGRNEALRWALGELVIGLVVLWAAAQGYSLPLRDDTPWLSTALNFALMVLVIWAFARAYDDVNVRAFGELQEAQQAKTTFLATISHEIRTPMNGVLGVTEAMLAEPVTPAQRENLQLIQRSGKLLVALINDLLDVTKAEAGKLTIDRHDFDLQRVLDDVRALFEPMAQQKGLSLSLQLETGVPLALRGDGMRVTQVLNNLVSNAVKFTPRGEVTVEVHATGPLRLRFEVRDTGIGMAPDLVPKLFTAFQQGDGSTTRRFGGSGLGLALAQQLVTMMGGHIEVESTPGRGSRFGFTLQFEPSSRTLVELTPPHGLSLASVKAGVVLVVDDNPINLAVAAQLVEKSGFLARKAASGSEALSLLSASNDVTLVLMDCHMPEMDGFEATERIRALATVKASLPIIALTASTLPEDLEACRRSGMNDVLIKPVALSTLSTVLHRFSTA